MEPQSSNSSNKRIKIEVEQGGERGGKKKSIRSAEKDRTSSCKFADRK